MNSRVNSRIFLLRSLGKSLSPYNKRYVKGSFGIFTYPSGRSNAKLVREDFGVESQRKGKATKSVPYSQYRRS